MMIHPEAYYISHLKGKSIAQIQSEINRLRRELNSIKREAESPIPCCVDPSYDIQVSFTRQYLAKAKQALIDLGGEYIPTKTEVRNEKFNEMVDTITNIHFTYGGFFDGYECKNFFFDKSAVFVQSYNAPFNADFKSFTVQPHHLSTSSFLSAIKSLNLGEWKKEYFNPYVCDGTQWSLRINFANSTQKQIDGSNAFPYNFDQLMSLLCPDND